MPPGYLDALLANISSSDRSKLNSHSVERLGLFIFYYLHLTIWNCKKLQFSKMLGEEFV